MYNMSLRANGEGPKSLRLTVFDLLRVLYLQGEITPIRGPPIASAYRRFSLPRSEDPYTKSFKSYLFPLFPRRRHKLFHVRGDNSVTKGQWEYVHSGQPSLFWLMFNKCTKFQQNRPKHFCTIGGRRKRKIIIIKDLFLLQRNSKVFPFKCLAW